MKGPALWFRPLTAAAVSAVSAAGSVPMWAVYMLTSRAQGPGVGLRLGDAGAGLDVGVQRDRDGGQDADDGHHDHQFDEGEAALVAQHLSSSCATG